MVRDPEILDILIRRRECLIIVFIEIRVYSTLRFKILDTCSSQMYICVIRSLLRFWVFLFFFLDQRNSMMENARSDFSGWRIEQFCNLITAWLESLEEFSGVTIRAVVRLFLSFICPLKIDVRFTMADNSADSRSVYELVTEELHNL